VVASRDGAALPHVSTFPVAPLAWAPTFQARVWTLRLAIETLEAARLDAFPRLTVVPPLAWQGAWPDAIDRAVLAAAAMPATVTGDGPSVRALPAPLVWLGVWPDLAPGLTLAAGQQQPTAAPTLIITNPAPVLSWAGGFADQTWAPAALAAAAQQAHAAWIRSALSIPVRAWQSHYPDDARGPAPLPPGAPPHLALSTLTVLPVPSLSWRGVFPDVMRPLMVQLLPSIFRTPVVEIGEPVAELAADVIIAVDAQPRVILIEAYPFRVVIP
jgi:hypothetical protein